MNFQLLHNSVEISKFCGKEKIPRFGSKFCGLWKTVGPTSHSWQMDVYAFQALLVTIITSISNVSYIIWRNMIYNYHQLAECVEQTQEHPLWVLSASAISPGNTWCGSSSDLVKSRPPNCRWLPAIHRSKLHTTRTLIITNSIYQTAGDIDYSPRTQMSQTVLTCVYFHLVACCSGNVTV